MVEMSETALILNNATRNSLVLLDEIGRGTSTFDGLSLAWATGCYIAEQINALTLFATHYFEMTVLPDRVETVKNLHLTATEVEDRIIFLYAVQSGPANQSYGIQVGKLAGLPARVIASAQEKLALLERQELLQTGLPMTSPPAPAPIQPQQSELFQPDDKLVKLKGQILDMELDHLSPRDALSLLYEIKDQLKETL